MNRKRRRGVSLLGVMISVAVLAITLFYFISGLDNLIAAKSQLHEKAYYESFIKTLVPYVAAGTYKFIQDVSPQIAGTCDSTTTPHCNGSTNYGGRLAIDFGSLPVGPFGMAMVGHSINPWPDFPARNAVIVNRCAAATTISCSTPGGAGTGFYFCLSFTLVPGASPPPDSFFANLKVTNSATGAIAAAAEIYVVLKDLAYLNDKSCNDYLSYSTSGEEIYYTLYWEAVGTGGPTFNQKSGVMFVSQSSGI